ncbi:MAG: peptidylprolyl isomerase [Bacilli bacterium]|nr:peptidylprolyl isomerase [Bacilli bacterium]
MAKDVKKTQKTNVKKEEKKIQPKKEIKSTKKVVIEEVVDTKNTTKEVVKKEKKKVTKNKGEKLSSIIKTVDGNRWVILASVVGFLIATLLFRCILWPDRIATLKDGTQPIASFTGETITADELYEKMKEHYSVNVLLNEIDNIILTEKYPDNDEMNTEVSETAEYYFNIYEQSYGYTKEDFLSNYGFASENDFIESLKLDYRRNKYYESYAEGLVTDKQIDKYYKDEVFGDVDSKHILVKIDKDSEDGLSDEEAKKLAKEIISKLNGGKTWDEVVSEYKDQIVNEELGYQAFNASLESSYLEECKKLEVGKYSKTPVLTSYGYHIVYKIDQKDKPSLEDVKDDVVDVLAADIKNDDTDLYYKALIAMRKDAKLEFTDTKLGDEYKEYTNNYK